MTTEEKIRIYFEIDAAEKMSRVLNFGRGSSCPLLQEESDLAFLALPLEIQNDMYNLGL
jgi:hypothetical protein